MNVERMYAVAVALRDELEETQTVRQMTTLRDSLQQQVANPGHPPYQQQVSDTLEKLREILAQAPSNQLSPAWELAAQEMGAFELMGARLSDLIESVFSRNQITPTLAHHEVESLVATLSLLHTALSEFVSSCEGLRVKGEDLAPGECELGVLMPRELVKNHLDAFAKELARLNRTLGPFAELATGTRPGYDIRSLSSSDLTVFLAVAPSVAACIAVAVERIVALYKQLLEIRVLRKQLSDQGLPAAVLQPIDGHANGVMSGGITVLVNELLDKYMPEGDAGRVNELRIELTSALNTVANRLDRGVRIEIRVKPLSAADTEPESAEAGQTNPLMTALRASKGIQFLRPAGEPILSLPEPASAEDESHPDTAS